MISLCPFCDAEVRENVCTACGRDPKATRRICSGCGKMTPSDETACCHCGIQYQSDLRWKIPVIIALFVAALIITILFEFWAG